MDGLLYFSCKRSCEFIDIRDCSFGILNSFSKKSVFFICLAITFIVVEVLKDMGLFYFKDVSVEIVGKLIKFAALKMVFLFFITKEKKLRLLNLV